jgi:hypothetical protein
MQGLALAWNGYVYVGAYRATSGAIQLFLTLTPTGRSLGPTRLGPHVPYPRWLPARSLRSTARGGWRRRALTKRPSQPRERVAYCGKQTERGST